MQAWMIILISVAAAVASIMVAVIVGALIFVHCILGRRKRLSDKKCKKLGYTPENYGMDVSWFDVVGERIDEVSITSFDGISLGAVRIAQPEKSKRVAICCHGYCATKRSTQMQAKMFYDRGFDVFMLAMRGHMGSGGKVGMAWLDRFDLMRWIDKVVTDYGSDVEIALYGISMGGSAVIAVAGMTPPSQVKCVIDDCGFNSQYDEYLVCLKNAKLPKCAIHLFNAGVRLVHGYSIYDADFSPLAKNIKIPALFFHGEADGFVPIALGKRLYESCGSPDKKFVSVPDAAHGCAYVKDKERYSLEFNTFLDKVFH